MSNHAAWPSPTSGLGLFGSGAAERLAAKTMAMAAAMSFVRIVLPSMDVHGDVISLDVCPGSPIDRVAPDGILRRSHGREDRLLQGLAGRGPRDAGLPETPG